MNCFYCGKIADHEERIGYDDLTNEEVMIDVCGSCTVEARVNIVAMTGGLTREEAESAVFSEAVPF